MRCAEHEISRFQSNFQIWTVNAVKNAAFRVSGPCGPTRKAGCGSNGQAKKKCALKSISSIGPEGRSWPECGGQVRVGQRTRWPLSPAPVARACTSPLPLRQSNFQPQRPTDDQMAPMACLHAIMLPARIRCWRLQIGTSCRPQRPLTPARVARACALRLPLRQSKFQPQWPKDDQMMTN